MRKALVVLALGLALVGCEDDTSTPESAPAASPSPFFDEPVVDVVQDHETRDYTATATATGTSIYAPPPPPAPVYDPCPPVGMVDGDCFPGIPVD